MIRIGRGRDERGLVAVIVALSSVALFAAAAVSVDLGNAYARKRAVQSQVDLAALAGGASLPGTKSATDPAVLAVAKYLNRNQPQSDGASCVSTQTCVTAAGLVDNNANNGEVYFTGTTQMRVVAPRAHVAVGLGRAVGGSDIDVAASATVKIESPGTMQPFMLPQQCTSGPMSLKDSSNDPEVTTFVPASGNGNGIAKVNSVSPLTFPGAVPSTLNLSGKNFDAPLTVDYFQASTGDRIPALATSDLPATKGADVGGDNTATTQLPAGVFNRPGTWFVRLKNSTGEYSRTYGSFIIGDPSPPAAGCGQSSTGDFGQLDSPRALVGQLDDATSLNIAKGLDHQLSLFPFPTYAYPPIQADSCNGNGGTVPPGAVNDKLSQAGNNCVNIKTGMNTNADTNGFVTGGSTGGEGSYTGLLEKPTTEGCDRNGNSDEATRLGHATNDDVLSCFLPTGVTVGDVTGATTPVAAVHSISSKIFESPRYAVVPIIHNPVNPQNGFYPIVAWQPVFITDESQASKHGESYASSQNGIVLRSSKVVGIKVIPINISALPETADTDGNTIDYLGSGPKVVRLVN